MIQTIDNRKIKKLPKNLSIFSKNKNFFYLNLKFYYNLIKYFFIILLDKKNLINFQFNKFLRREIVKILAESDFSKVFIIIFSPNFSFKT